MSSPKGSDGEYEEADFIKNPGVGVRWIYARRIDELNSLSDEFGFKADGTVEETRKAFANLVNSGSFPQRVWNRLAELQELYSSRAPSPVPSWKKDETDQFTESLRVPIVPDPAPVEIPGRHRGVHPGTSQGLWEPPTDPRVVPNPQGRDARSNTTSAQHLLPEKIHKWNLRFDGSADPLALIAALEEKMTTYRINPEEIPRALSEILEGPAAQWFRTCYLHSASWRTFRKEFLDLFLPPRYFESLVDEIRTRVQMKGESFKTYLIELMTKMQQAGYREGEELYRAYENMAPEYRLYIKRSEFMTLKQLTCMATEYESVKQLESTRNRTPGATTESDEGSQIRRPPNPFRDSEPTTPTGHATHRMIGQGIHGGLITATIKVGGKWVDATVDTVASRSFASESFTNLAASAGEVRDVVTRIALADRSCLDVTKLWRTPVTLAGTTVLLPMLVMPTMLDRVILGMDFLKTAGTRVHCGEATLELQPEPQVAGDPLLTPVLMPWRDKRREAVYPGESRVQLGTASQGEVEVLGPAPKRAATAPNEVEVSAGTEAKQHDEEQQITPLSPRQKGFIDREVALFEILQGVSHVAEHRIVMRDDKPLKLRSPHSAPIVLVKKKAGDWRMCIDYRQLIAHSVPDAYAVPRINHILEKLRHARYIFTLDLKNGYWQIPMARDSRQYTAFTVPGRGLYQWKVMPFGLHSAGATFQRALDSVVGAEMEPVAFAYLDDIIVISATEEQHFANLAEVFRRLRAANLRINPKKCTFFQQRLVYLGHVISGEGVQTDPEKPVSALLKKGRKWSWGPEQQAALEEIRRCLTTAPVLGCPDFDQRFILQTDASDVGLEAVLSQGQEKVIAYASHRLTPTEQNYTTTEKECLAIIWAIRKMRCYLEGYRFEVVTDHLALKWLNSIESPSGRIARWAL
ncbi:uncharacterized protein LOC122320067 [Drosophila ficusphila]|uniref:uncharacterized protein LOC122320067 n=1 Tax=Drosophila ficusphila TaxID=30025 RepID=UPI001C8A19F5|nr:uncharacterized protein LOC122320067 [Drosophila ficusphila]